MKSSKKHSVISTVLCAMTLVILLSFYNKLPESVPVHFDAEGNANSFWSRNAVVFGLPAASVTLNLIACFSFNKQEDKAPFMFYIIPVAAVITTVIMLYMGMK